MTGKLPININHLLRQRTIEGERIEYKAGWNPQSVLHTVCAFANDFHNLGGGYVVLGVKERDGRPVLPPKGIPPDSVDAIQKELLNLGNSAIQPYYHPLTGTYAIDGRTILVLWVPGGETRPYKAKVTSHQRGARSGPTSSANTQALSAREAGMNASCSAWRLPCPLMTGIARQLRSMTCRIGLSKNSCATSAATSPLKRPVSRLRAWASA